LRSFEQRFLHNSSKVYREKERSQTAPTFKKGFHETLFECLHSALATALGEDVASTFDYAIQQSLGLSANEFKEKPLEAIEGLRSILGKAGFKVVEPVIKDQIKRTFAIREDIKSIDFTEIAKIAERNYLRAEF
jgi:hypothetical protein